MPAHEAGLPGCGIHMLRHALHGRKMAWPAAGSGLRALSPSVGIVPTCVATALREGAAMLRF